MHMHMFIFEESSYISFLLFSIFFSDWTSSNVDVCTEVLRGALDKVSHFVLVATLGYPFSCEPSPLLLPAVFHFCLSV